MKRYLLNWLAILFCTMTLISCEKDPEIDAETDPGSTNNDLGTNNNPWPVNPTINFAYLTEKQWKYTDKILINTGTYESHIEDCEKDNIYTFTTGTYAVHDYSITHNAKCFTGQADVESGTYIISGNYLVFNYVPNYPSPACTIVEISSTTLKFTQAQYMYVYTAQ